MEIQTSLSESIRHKAEIIHTLPAKGIKVKIIQDGGCSGCAAAKICGAAQGDSSPEIFIPISNTEPFRKGMIVEVEGSEQLHRKAIRLATVYPTIAIIAVMTAVYLITGNQLVAALSALTTMLMFFILLWISRNKLRREFAFKIVSP